MADSLGGWEYMLLSWDWHAMVHAGFPGWEMLEDNEPFSVFLDFTSGAELCSRGIANEWDDIARHNLYYRDWTSGGSPFVPESEKYWSTFSFQRKKEAVRFREKYGGKVNWEPGWQIHLDAIFKRNL